MDDRTQRAIAHLFEALMLLACVRDQGDTSSVPIHIGPANTGHTVHVTAKTAEAIADAVDSMNAYLGSEPVPADPEETTVDPALVDELEKHCLGMDADFLMELAAKNPNAAVAAFDEIFEYASYEQILREDGGEL